MDPMRDDACTAERPRRALGMVMLSLVSCKVTRL